MKRFRRNCVTARSLPADGCRFRLPTESRCPWFFYALAVPRNELVVSLGGFWGLG